MNKPKDSNIFPRISNFVKSNKLLVLFAITLCLVVLVLGGYFGWKKTIYNNPVKNIPVTQKPIVNDCSVTDTDVINAVNKYRAEIGVAPVTFNERLDNFSNQRAIEQNGVLDNHLGLIGAANKLGYESVAEDQNRWPGCHNSEARVLDFKLSEKHWKSLMNPGFTTIGVGFYDNILNINLISL